MKTPPRKVPEGAAEDSTRHQRIKGTKRNAPRLLAWRALIDAAKSRRFVDEALEDAFADFPNISREDRALATNLVQTTVRQRGAIDYRLSQLLERGLGSLPEGVQAALRLGAVQLWYLDRIPEHAAVNESVNLVKFAGFEGYVPVVNGVLRRIGRGDVPELPTDGSDESLAARHSLPVWMIRRWAHFGADRDTIIAGSNRIPKLVLRARPSAMTRAELMRVLRLDGIEVEASPLSRDSVRVLSRFDLTDFGPFRSGAVSVQDESEALVVELVEPLPTHRILDVCAAPGGKTMHIADRSTDLAWIVAHDASPSRLRRVRENVDRARRLGRVALVAGDGREIPLAGTFDRVVVDAPCTGTGVLARRADARWRLEAGDVASRARLQADLLNESAKKVALGGFLVYSVCSIEPEETTGVVDAFLESHREFALEPVESLPAAARDDKGRLFLLPGAHDTDGVFGVRLRRTA